MRDDIAIPIIFIISFFVGMSALATIDPNNPMPELGPPVTLDSFNPFSIAGNLPQIPTVSFTFSTTSGSSCAWWDVVCWTGSVFDTTIQIAVTLANAIIWFVNVVIIVFGVPITMAINFFTIFAFPLWPVFQANVFMLTIGGLMSATFGFAIFMWIYDKVPIPFSSRGGG